MNRFDSFQNVSHSKPNGLEGFRIETEQGGKFPNRNFWKPDRKKSIHCLKSGILENETDRSVEKLK